MWLVSEVLEAIVEGPAVPRVDILRITILAVIAIVLGEFDINVGVVSLDGSSKS